MTPCLPHPTVTTSVLPASTALPILDVAYDWNPVAWGRLCLVFPSVRNVLGFIRVVACIHMSFLFMVSRFD